MHRRNPAIARREHAFWTKKLVMQNGEEEERDVREWRDTPPSLTRGHFEAPATRRALAIANEARAGRGEFLGLGHFGKTYRVETAQGPVVVKISRDHDSRRRPRPLAEAQNDLRQEAGVANELYEEGFRIVPKTVYVEFSDGWPALVREYGEPVKELQPHEFEQVEASLMLVEKVGWRVHDRIDLYRRPDGSLYVGDVGIWGVKPTYDKGAAPSWNDSDLPGLLDELAQNLLTTAQGIRMPRGWSLSRMKQVEEGLLKYIQRFDPSESDPSFLFELWGEEAEKGIEARKSLGLRVPQGIVAALAQAKSLLAHARKANPIPANVVNKQLYARVKADAKRKFKVYPSAYANAWLVQEYKRRGGRYSGPKPRRSANPADFFRQGR